MTKEIRYDDKKFSSWNGLVKFHREKQNRGNWIFRGLRDSNYGFKTSFERTLLNLVEDKHLPHKRRDIDREKDKKKQRKMRLDNLRFVLKNGLENKNVHELENGLVRRFQRQYHQYAGNIPDRENIIEWLSLMQHYGAPTNLLDWTYSFFVAVYFAVEDTEKECAVWALNTDWVVTRLRKTLPNSPRKELDDDINLENAKILEKVFRRKQRAYSLVYPINAYVLNDRLIIQQGLFLLSGNIRKPFEDNLAEFQGNARGAKNALVKIIIKGDVKTRKEILQNLHRMNMNRATLFPGIDGFATSLRTLLVFPKILKPWTQKELQD